MTKAKAPSYAFSIATRDPNTDKRGLIGDREVYDRRFTIGEIQEISDRVREVAIAKHQAGEPFGVRDEVEIFASVLSRRVADDQGPLDAEALMALLTDEQYGEVVRHFAPSLMEANGVASAGKAQSSAK